MGKEIATEIGYIPSLSKNKVSGSGQVCSPSNKEVYDKYNTCLTKDALVRLIQVWNQTNPNLSDQISIQKKSRKRLWNELNERMKQICKGSGLEYCWMDKLKAKKIPEIAKSFRPAIPEEWNNNPYEWLSNIDIENVMIQYEDDTDLHYKFLGVFPIDFAKKTAVGTCMVSELCTIDITKYAKKGYKYLGLITNLDTHDEPGSHWTSLFICIDATKPCFGAYYYDSVSNSPPREIVEFMNKVKTQALTYAKEKHINRDFKLDYNRVRHQYKGSECGMFSMAYQIRWLDLLKNKENITFQDIVKVKINDEYIHKYRHLLFRPNTTSTKN